MRTLVGVDGEIMLALLDATVLPVCISVDENKSEVRVTASLSTLVFNGTEVALTETEVGVTKPLSVIMATIVDDFVT